MKSTDYDEKILRYEQQLKKWKAERKHLASKEAKEAKKESERRETERLLALGSEADLAFAWMRDTTIRQKNGERISVWQWYEQSSQRNKCVIDANDTLEEPDAQKRGVGAQRPTI